jgi:hypothetical protein
MTPSLTLLWIVGSINPKSWQLRQTQVLFVWIFFFKDLHTGELFTMSLTGKVFYLTSSRVFSFLPPGLCFDGIHRVNASFPYGPHGCWVNPCKASKVLCPLSLTHSVICTLFPFNGVQSKMRASKPQFSASFYIHFPWLWKSISEPNWKLKKRG